MIRITMTNPNSPLTMGMYPKEWEEQVVANLESKGYTIVMIESL